MRMFQMVRGKTTKDRVKSELILKMIGVEPWKNILRSQRLKWFGQVERMNKKSSSDGYETNGEKQIERKT